MTSLPRLRTSCSTSPHSVGVRWTSAPSRITFLAARSTRKSVGLDDRQLLDRGGPAHRGPQPGQQLVHAERLGQVVVGAGVERLDLVVLVLADRQDDDGHRAPAPQAAHHLDAVDAGQADVEHHHVGMALGRQAQRLLAGGGQVDLVLAGAQVGGQGPPDLRLVVDHQHAGHGRACSRGHGRGRGRGRTGRLATGRRSARRRRWPGGPRSEITVVSPPPGVSSRISSPSMASVKPRATARPSPTPVHGGPVPQPLERLEDALAVGGAHPGALVDDAQVRRGRRPRPPRCAAGRSSGE